MITASDFRVLDDSQRYGLYAETVRQRDKLAEALRKAKPIVGAAVAGASNEARPLRERVYDQMVAALAMLPADMTWKPFNVWLREKIAAHRPLMDANDARDADAALAAARSA